MKGAVYFQMLALQPRGIFSTVEEGKKNACSSFGAIHYYERFEIKGK